MLNRRKYQPETSNQVGDEREALLANNDLILSQDFHNSQPDHSNQTFLHGYPKYSKSQPTNNPFGDDKGSKYSQQQVQLPTIPLTPVKRKARSKSPQPDYRHHDFTPLNSYQQQSNPKPAGYYESYQFRRNTPAVSVYPGEGSVELNLYDPYPNRLNNITDYVYYTVQPGDTLHNLSIKYSCPISSIKRLNNLLSDQEFYGLTRLKLPAGKLRLIADAIGETNNNNDTIATLTQANNLYAGPTSSPTTSTNPETDAQLGSESYFKNLDSDIQKARTAALSYNENASAIMQSLADGGNIVDENDLNDQIKIATREAESLLIDMSDYGLTYSGLILFIFIVCLILPLAYVIYLEETHTHPLRNET